MKLSELALIILAIRLKNSSQWVDYVLWLGKFLRRIFRMWTLGDCSFL